MFEITLIMGLVIIILGIVCFFSIKGNINQKKNYSILEDILESYKNASIKMNIVENKKTEIREEYNEIENNINNGPDMFNGVMPVNPKPKHNHDFGSPCGKDCPAYTGK